MTWISSVCTRRWPTHFSAPAPDSRVDSELEFTFLESDSFIVIEEPLSELVKIVSTALLPLTSFISLSIFLSTHPRSPTRKWSKRRIALPVHTDEGLDGGAESEKDPFDIDDPVVRKQGNPVNPEKFWSSTWKRKAWLLATMLLPLGCNIALLVMTSMADYPSFDAKTKALSIPMFILASHVPTFVTMYWYLSHDNVESNWQTTIHLSVDLAAQFLVIAILVLLPSTAPPRRRAEALFVDAFFLRSDVIKMPHLSAHNILYMLLPILQLIPLVIVCCIRRGPPIHLPMDAIYPPKIVDAIPADHESLDPNARNVSEEVEVNVIEYMIFSYATPVIEKGATAESMNVWDVPILPISLRAMNNFLWIKGTYRKPKAANWEGYNLLWVLAKTNAGLFIAMLIMAAVTAVMYYLPHYILQKFIVYLENDPTRSDPSWGWLLAFGLFISNASVFIVTGINWGITTTYLQGKINMQLNSLLFAKTLVKKDVAGGGDKKEEKEKPSGEEKGKDEDEEDEGVSSKSQIMNLFTVDVDRVNEFVFHAFSLVDSPIEIVVATLFLINLLGVSAIWGLLTSILCMPLTHLASKYVVAAQENLMKARDKRTGLMNEILQGIRMLKFMAWERSFQKRVNDIRKDELHWQARNYQIEVGFNCLYEITPILVTVVAFLHYTLVAGKTLSPSIAFTSIAVFDELRFALGALPETFIQALQGFVSCRRIEKYLQQEDVDFNIDYDGEGDIILANATFTWPRDLDSYDPSTPGTRSAAPTPKLGFTLADLSLHFPKGQLSLVCGRLGSGKSLLLAGLLGEADLLAGHIECPRSSPNAMGGNEQYGIKEEDWVVPSMLAYVPQQAWLQNASIKDNIVFSSPWVEDRYQAVLEACSLLSDLQILEDGDQTEIGEKGLNLSGGQKARVSLARAVYSRAGTLLLDDVLSAVDAHTAHDIMENCLTGKITAGRTIILVSHHTALVAPAAAFIVALENGDVKFSGTKEQFVAGGLMAELDEKTKNEPESPIEEKTLAQATKKAPINKSLVNITQEASEPSSETSSIAPDDEEGTLVSSTSDLKVKVPRKLIEDERRATGRISWAVWKTYFNALGGKFWWFCFVIALLINMGASPLQKGWLKYWTSADPDDPNSHSAMFFVVGYALICVGGVWIYGLQYAVMYWGSLKASSKLHANMLETVLFAPLRFHDTTSRGRLLNRFGKDIEGLDSEMADHFVRSITYGGDVVVTIVSIAYIGGLPFIGATALLMVLYYKSGSIYGQTSRDMRRLNSVTRSPLYSLFAETVAGVSVIRAFGASTIELRKMLALADTNIVAYAWTWTVNRWLSARFNILSSIIVGITALNCLLSPGVTASQAGFALSFASSIQQGLLFVVRRFVQLEQSMVALERIKEYTELKKEAPEFIDPRPPASWPHEGVISVEKLAIRYAPDLPNVLHGISFSVAPRQKIGIVGATGCGKSTLALSFFRFVEAHAGRIIIDGLDISQIGLTDLRSRVTIIPQDPTILSGTIRSTLDVFDEYDDVDIYAALKRVHLLKEDDDTSGTVIEGDDEERNLNVFKDLSNPVSEGGDNFSTGEKQLICMARAILRRNKVLVMDEATASIDYDTDALISKTIREEFSESTILTIAHRIHTIIDFDRVLVMDKGNIAEFASPAELLRNHKSKFYALCKATGKTEFQNLKEMAKAAERETSSDA